MSTYGVLGSSVTSLSLLAVTDQIRIARVEGKGIATATPGAAVTFRVLRYTGASHSGGTLLTPQPMRAGANAPLATARSGATTSGTSAVLDHAVSQDPSGTAPPPPLSAAYSAVFDLILDPGMAVRAEASVAAGSLLIFFEVLQLNWSY